MADYKLPFTGNEILDKLNNIDTLESNVAELKSDLSEISNEIKDGYVSLDHSNFTNGTWYTGHILTEPTRICTKKCFKVHKGDRLVYKTNSLMIAYGIYEKDATASSGYTTWHNVSEHTEKILHFNGDLFVQLKKTDDSVVSASDFDAEVKIYRTYAEKNEIKNIKSDLQYTISKDINDADYIRRVNPSEYIDRKDGTRIRIVFIVNEGSTLKIPSFPKGKGISTNLYGNIYDAFFANTNQIESVTGSAYTLNDIEHTFSNSGFLTVSLCKADSSSFTDDEMNDYLKSINISLVSDRNSSLRIERIEESLNGKSENTSNLNSDMIGAIVSASGFNTYKSGGYVSADGKKKNLSFSVITDVHGSYNALKRFVKFSNDKNEYLDFLLCLGDTVPVEPIDGQYELNEIVKESTIPFLYTLGNHDVSDTGRSGITQSEARNAYFSTIEEKGWISENEFMSDGKCSWFKDFSDYKIRVISLFEYGNSTTISDNAPNTYCRRWLDSETLQWFANTLYNTPLDYSVIVLLHQIPMYPITYIEGLFTQSNEYKTSPEPYFLNTIDGSPIEEIVNAYMNGVVISKTYNSIQSFGIDKTATVYKDFSKRGTGEFIAYFVGHLHQHLIFKGENYPKQITIGIPSGSENLYQRSFDDTPYVSSTRNCDNFFVVGIDTLNRKINIVKIGGQTTFDMRERKMIEIPY